MRDRRHVLGGLALLALALGCTPSPGSGPDEDSAMACEVEMPSEVGDLTLHGQARCTATLIGPRVALTAAHCLWPPFVGSGRDLAVSFVQGKERRSFPVRRVRSFDLEGVTASETGLNHDVALLELGSSVPASLAVPRALATEPLTVGASVTIVTGANCGQALPVEGHSLKGFRFDPRARDRQLCPGDSGAPVLDGPPVAPGRIVAIASGYLSTACAAGAPDRMLFGDVARLSDAIQAQELAWLRTPLPATD